MDFDGEIWMLILHSTSIGKVNKLEADISIGIKSSIGGVILSLFIARLVVDNALSHEFQKLWVTAHVLNHSEKVMSVKW